MPAILGALQRGNGLPGAEVRESIVPETVTKAIPEIVPETVPGIDAETVTEIGTENSSSVLIDNLSAPAPPLKSHAITSDALPDPPPTYVASNRAPNPLQPRPPPPKSHDTLNAVGPRRTGGWGAADASHRRFSCHANLGMQNRLHAWAIHKADGSHEHTEPGHCSH